MGTTTLIWDQTRVVLWRAERQGCVTLADGVASTAEAVVDFLESHADALSITRFIMPMLPVRSRELRPYEVWKKARSYYKITERLQISVIVFYETSEYRNIEMHPSSLGIYIRWKDSFLIFSKD